MTTVRIPLGQNYAGPPSRSTHTHTPIPLLLACSLIWRELSLVFTWHSDLDTSYVGFHSLRDHEYLSYARVNG